MIVSGNTFRVKIKQTTKRKLNTALILDLIFVFFALTLLALNIFQISGGLLQLFFAFFCTSFLLGYSILNIIGLTPYFSRLENLIFSYLLSYAFTGFITFFSLPLNLGLRTSVVSISFIVSTAQRRFHSVLSSRDPFGPILVSRHRIVKGGPRFRWRRESSGPFGSFWISWMK